jgi:hypothetical protein
MDRPTETEFGHLVDGERHVRVLRERYGVV